MRGPLNVECQNRFEGVREEVSGAKMEGRTCIWRWLSNLKNVLPGALRGGLIKGH